MVVTMERWCRGDGVDVVVRVAMKMMMTTVLWWWRGDDDEPVGGDDVDGVRMVMVVSMGLRWDQKRNFGKTMVRDSFKLLNG
ncbi:hypothetical protein Tco_0859657 [Tanacetum coccineum]|uniref:Uncharacterized protein n=1 Tax=Tanacetum coccineum TaxID=301880 RepID=A0ABQ5BCK8_9ASTR